MRCSGRHAFLLSLVNVAVCSVSWATVIFSVCLQLIVGWSRAPCCKAPHSDGVMSVRGCHLPGGNREQPALPPAGVWGESRRSRDWKLWTGSEETVCSPDRFLLLQLISRVFPGVWGEEGVKGHRSEDWEFTDGFIFKHNTQSMSCKWLSATTTPEIS